MERWEEAREYETGLALSVKPLPHGRMKFRKPPASQQVFHIENFAGEIGRDKQVAGSDIVGGSKTGAVGVLRGGVGSAENAFSNCPHCGEALNLPKTPRFCPYCGAGLG